MGSNLANSDSSRPVAIRRTRIRAPQRHGETLVLPQLSEIGALWNRNLQAIEQHRFIVNGQPIDQLRVDARKHLIAAAQSYSSQYCDVAKLNSSDSPPRVIMSGHQPRLFHPGVWFKNFALSALGQQLNAIAVNLVVDNDLCASPHVTVPQTVGSDAKRISIAYDSVDSNIPFEHRKIEDSNVFSSFGERCRVAIAPVVENPIVEPLWQNAMSYRDPQNRLGHTLAAARHKLESDLGLQTLEIPLSQFCSHQSFAHFLLEIANRIDPFQEIYNRSLLEYRQVNRVRSNAHPVPELERVDDWFEMPFWVWSNENPVRSALYVQRTAQQTTLSDRKGWKLTLSADQPADQLASLSEQGIAIRPRALTTTMYSRLFLSDLFIHGIGGSKYDQLTDAIIARFWNVQPPEYLTVTATFTLPFDFQPTTIADVTAETVRLRELRFHPERFVDQDNETAKALIEEKSNWIRNAGSIGLKQRHDSIERCNRSLVEMVADQVKQVEAERERKKSQLASSRIFSSREYSFCCFSMDRIDGIQRLFSGR